MKYVHLGSEGKILGWYDDLIHHAIPDGSNPVSEEQWNFAINNSCNYCINGEFKSIVEKDTRTYREKRRAEYPPVEDYLDAIVKNDIIQKQEYVNKCLAVKAKYPKE